MIGGEAIIRCVWDKRREVSDDKRSRINVDDARECGRGVCKYENDGSHYRSLFWYMRQSTEEKYNRDENGERNKIFSAENDEDRLHKCNYTESLQFCFYRNFTVHYGSVVDMRILIIEDNRKLALSLKRGLEQEGYAADAILDGNEGEVSVRSLVGIAKRVCRNFASVILWLHPKTQEVMSGGEKMNLTLKEFRILEFFMQHPG